MTKHFTPEKLPKEEVVQFKVDHSQAIVMVIVTALLLERLYAAFQAWGL